MSEFWEVWDVVSANALAAFDSESEALAFVRELLGKDWTADELVMIFDDPALADEDLPPGVTGEERARRAETAGLNPVRRTA